MEDTFRQASGGNSKYCGLEPSEREAESNGEKIREVNRTKS